MKKKVLVIGGSSGLGRQLAAVYAAKGNTVAVIARRGQLLTELRSELPNIIVRQADIAQENITDIIAELVTEMKGLDILILAASIIHFNPDLNPLPEKETVSVNVDGFLRIVDFAWPYLKSQGGGQIVGITSIAGGRGNKMAPAYHASKAFQSIYLESLRVRAGFERNNVYVTELVPGYMDTAMGRGDRLFWVAPVQKAAAQAYRAIEKKKRKAFLTKRWRIVYYIQKHMPIFLYDRFVNGKWKLKH